MMLGLTRFVWWEQALLKWDDFDGQVVEFSGLVERQELFSSSKQRLHVRVLQAGDARLNKQKVQIILPIWPPWQVGAFVDVQATLQRPQAGDGIRYDRISAVKGVFLQAEKTQLHQRDQSLLFLEHPFIWTRVRVLNAIQGLWPRPNGSLVRGLLLGDRADFSEEVIQDFSAAGISHIIALSGFNIAVIFNAIEALTLRMGLSKRGRTMAMLVVMAIFVILVGAASSILRAAAMGTLAVIGKALGRKPRVGRLLLISATVMTMMNPYVLLYDVGFQLSCLATAGLLCFSERFHVWFRWLPDIGSMRSSLATTLAASVPTLPLLMFQFGRVSLIAPFTNILVLPLIPWLMAAAAVAVTLSWLARPLAAPVGWLVSLGCHYILDLSHVTAHLPISSQPVQISPLIFVAEMVLVACWMAYEHHAKSVKSKLR